MWPGCARLTGALNIIERPALVGAVVERTIVGSKLGSRYRACPHRMPVIELCLSLLDLVFALRRLFGKNPQVPSAPEPRRLCVL